MSNRRKNQTALLIGGGLLVLLLLLIGGGAAVYFVNKNSASSESLPAHFGLFFQNQDKNAISEIKKQDFTSVTAAKDEILKNENLPNFPSQPNFVLYAENNDIPLADLKLIQLDSIKEDGSLKQLDIQAAPVEGKPEMKRIRIPESVANGKYAFALFNGYFDEGKHKFWAFSVKNDAKSDNGEIAKNINLNLKPKDENTAIFCGTEQYSKKGHLCFTAARKCECVAAFGSRSRLYNTGKCRDACLFDSI